jgi:hypothetical protein
MWKMLVDYKYNVSPNIFHGRPPPQCSPFWKGVMWAAAAAKIGFRWSVGKGEKVLFREDIFIGNCSLAILYWDLYVIVNEQKSTIADPWDGRT